MSSSAAASNDGSSANVSESLQEIATLLLYLYEHYFSEVTTCLRISVVRVTSTPF